MQADDDLSLLFAWLFRHTMSVQTKSLITFIPVSPSLFRIKFVIPILALDNVDEVRANAIFQKDINDWIRAVPEHDTRGQISIFRLPKVTHTLARSSTDTGFHFCVDSLSTNLFVVFGTPDDVRTCVTDAVNADILRMRSTI